jgi:hypothetical protein
MCFRPKSERRVSPRTVSANRRSSRHQEWNRVRKIGFRHEPLLCFKERKLEKHGGEEHHHDN